MRLMVTTAAQKFIMMKGGAATAKLEIRSTKSEANAKVKTKPSVRLGQPELASRNEYKEVEVHRQVKIYLDTNILNLDDSYSPEIDVVRSIFGKKLVLKGV